MDDIRKELLEEFRKRYESEVSRRTDLNSRLGILLGVLSLLVGGGITVLKNPPVNGPLLLVLVFWSGVVVSTFIVLLLLNDIRKFLFGFTYGYVSDPATVDDYLGKINEFNDCSTAEDNIDIESDIHTMLYEQYRDMATRFSENNHLKTIYLYRSFRKLFIMVAVVFASSVPYLLLRQHNPDIQHISVVTHNSKETDMAPDNDNKTPSNQKPTQSEQEPSQQQAPERPTRPQPQLLKEADDRPFEKRGSNKDD